MKTRQYENQLWKSAQVFWPLKLRVNGFAAKNYGFYIVMT